MELFRSGEMDSYYALRDIGESEDDPFCFGNDPLGSLTVEEKVRFHMTSFLHVDFGSRMKSTRPGLRPSTAIKEKWHPHVWQGKLFHGDQIHSPPYSRDIIDEEDQERVAAAFRLLNWLSLHPEKITKLYEEYLPYDVRPHAVLYKPLPDGSYERDIIDAPERKMFSFEPVPLSMKCLPTGSGLL